MVTSRRSDGDSGPPSSCVERRDARLAVHPDFRRAVQIGRAVFERIGQFVREDDMVGLRDIDAMR